MIRLIITGCNGKMGRVLTELVRENPMMTIVAGVDINTSIFNEYPVYSRIGDCKEEADVVIDFSLPDITIDMLNYCEDKHLGLVLCTTGLNEEILYSVEEKSKTIPILRSSNMSLGINLLTKLLKEATLVLSPAGFDIEILEKHHNLKKDAPSGTAISLGEAINEELGGEYVFRYDRSNELRVRDNKEIGISAIRGGTIVGEHQVIFAGTDEELVFTHIAHSKSIFAKGAIEAARYLNGRSPGLYQMKDVIG